MKLENEKKYKGSLDIRLMFFNLFFLLKEIVLQNFIVFCQILNMNQPQIYIYPLPFETPSHIPPHPTTLG